MGRHYLDKNTQVGKLYALLKRRRGWVDAGEIARHLPTTCVSTVVSNLRLELKYDWWCELNINRKGEQDFIIPPVRRARRISHKGGKTTFKIVYQYRLVRG